MYLRQSTASQTRTIGPFVDDTDFKTLENALSIANTDILLKKVGGASAAKNSGGATADGSGGMYHLTFDATDSGTVGELFGSVKVAGALVVFFRFVVLEEAIYDALFAASAPGYLQPATAGRTLVVDASGLADANMVKIDGDATSLADFKDLVDAAYDPTNHYIDANIVRVAGTVQTAGDIYPALTNIENLIGTPIDLNGGGATLSFMLQDIFAVEASAADIADAVWDELLSGHAVSGSTGEALSAAGSAGDPWITDLPGSYTSGQAGYIIGTYINASISSRASQTSVDTIDDYVDTEIAAILAAVDTEIATILSRLGTPSDLGSGASLSANMVDIESQTDDIGVAGAGLTAADDAILAAIAALNNITAASVWAVGTRTLTAIDEDSTTLDLDATIRAAIGMASADLDTQLSGLVSDVGDTQSDLTTLLSRIGSPSNLGSGASLAANMVDVEGETDDIGAAGIGLSAIPWNASWDAEVQSEVADALHASLTEPYRATEATGSVAELLYEILGNLINKRIEADVAIVTNLAKDDDVKQYQYDNGTTPTAIEELV